PRCRADAPPQPRDPVGVLPPHRPPDLEQPRNEENQPRHLWFAPVQPGANTPRAAERPPGVRSRQTSRFLTNLAFDSMNARRSSTSSPMSVEKIRSAATASSRVTWRIVRVSGSIVVFQS